MKVTVTKRFYGHADNESAARNFEVGEEIEGQLAITAVQLGHAQSPKKKPPENKATAPPLNKSGSASEAGRASQKKTSKKRKG